MNACFHFSFLDFYFYIFSIRMPPMETNASVLLFIFFMFMQVVFYVPAHCDPDTTAGNKQNITICFLSHFHRSFSWNCNMLTEIPIPRFAEVGTRNGEACAHMRSHQHINTPLTFNFCLCSGSLFITQSTHVYFYRRTALRFLYIYGQG